MKNAELVVRHFCGVLLFIVGVGRFGEDGIVVEIDSGRTHPDGFDVAVEVEIGGYGAIFCQIGHNFADEV